MKKLVAYYSASGRTARLADKLAEAVGADIYEIKPAVPYTKEDLNWQDPNSRSSVECKDRSIRPELAETKSMADYDVIYIGYPVWWGREPNVIATFLASEDLAGKTIVPFATSGGSPIGNAPEYLKEAAPNAVITKGKVMSPRIEVPELKAWAEKE